MPLWIFFLGFPLMTTCTRHRQGRGWLFYSWQWFAHTELQFLALCLFPLPFNHPPRTLPRDTMSTWFSYSIKALLLNLCYMPLICFLLSQKIHPFYLLYFIYIKLRTQLKSLSSFNCFWVTSKHGGQKFSYSIKALLICFLSQKNPPFLLFNT